MQNYLPYLFSATSQASLYEQFSYKWTVNHLGFKSNECISKLRSPKAHFEHKRQITARRTKYTDLTQNLGISEISAEQSVCYFSDKEERRSKS